MPEFTQLPIEVYVSFESEDLTPFADALRSLRTLTFDAPTMEVGEHYGTLIIKGLEIAADNYRG